MHFLLKKKILLIACIGDLISCKHRSCNIALKQNVNIKWKQRDLLSIPITEDLFHIKVSGRTKEFGPPKIIIMQVDRWLSLAILGVLSVDKHEEFGIYCYILFVNVIVPKLVKKTDLTVHGLEFLGNLNLQNKLILALTSILTTLVNKKWL